MIKTTPCLSQTQIWQKRMRSYLLPILCLSFISTMHLANAQDKVRGEQLSQTCLGCHGVPGLRNPSPVYSIPMIGGQNADYLVAALKEYKAKTRSHPTMQAQASNLSEQDMLDIAHYFSSIAKSDQSKPKQVDTQLASRGKALITPNQEGKIALICVSCHGESGDNNNPAFSAYPRLAGQYESYLIQALKDYRNGKRQNPIMGGQAKDLTIEEIRALAAWFSSQSGALSAPNSTLFK